MSFDLFSHLAKIWLTGRIAQGGNYRTSYERVIPLVAASSFIRLLSLVLAETT